MPTLLIDQREARVDPGQTLFDAAESVGVRVPTSCVKQGKCRECLLEVVSGGEHLVARAPEEAHLGDGFRLACRTRFAVDGDVTAHCQTMRRGALRILDKGSGLPTAAESALEPRDGFGLAVDVGTTTVATRLYDLRTGRLVAAQSFENPQRFGGSDVMARIHYDTSHKGRLLQRTLLGYLRQALERFPVEPESIVEVVAAGNATMRDLLFGLDVYPIGQKPYRSTHEKSLSVPARKLRLPLHPDAVVHGLPILGSHVGADAAACVLATDMHRSERVSVLMDIGTNTELVVGNRDRLVAASCPAGPAFEGGGLGCGMPALEGAVESASLDDEGNWSLEVIGGGPPAGICGSGLVDVMAELLRTERMNAQGRFAEGIDDVALAPGIVFTESDVNELAQAKGANVAGLQILREVFELDLEAIGAFYLAGGFASHLDLAAARRVGLIPDLPDETVTAVGNAALEGVSLALLSPSLRAELDAVAERVEHVELETHPGFFDFFVEGCQFVPVGAEVLGG